MIPGRFFHALRAMRPNYHAIVPGTDGPVADTLCGARAVAATVLCVAIAPLCGCGGGEPPAPPPVAAAPAPAAQPTPPVQPTVVAKQPAPAPAPVEAPNPPPPPPARPGDVSQWKPDDYRQARREHDPRLIDAVAQLGPAQPESEPAAKLLVELLAPPPAPLAPIAAPSAAQPPGATPSAPSTAPPAAPAAVAPPAAPAAVAPPAAPAPAPAPAEPPQTGAAGEPSTVVEQLRRRRAERAAAEAAQPPAAPPAEAPVSPPPPAPIDPAAQPSPAAASPATPKPLDEPALVTAIVEALGANQTPFARDALGKLLGGQLRTGVADAIATGLAAQVLLVRPSAAETDLILAALTDPARLRPSGTLAPAAAAELQSQIAAALDRRASSAARKTLAEIALAADTSEANRKLIVDLLLKPAPANLAAQTKLFASGQMEPAAMLELERRFAAASAATTERLLGLPADALPSVPAAGEFSSDSASLQATVESVWQGDIIPKLRADSAKVERLMDYAAPLLLATAIPTTEVRTILGDLQRAHWAEGTENLPLGARFGDVIRDPGLLIVAKRSPRKEDPSRRKARASRNVARSAARVVATGGAGSDVAGGDRVQREERAKHQWMNSTEEFVRSLNARFLQAAQAGAGSRPQGSDQSSPATQRPPGSKTAQAAEAAATPAATRAARFPLQLHPDAKVVAEYHLAWPDDLPENLRQIDVTPLAVHYVRMEAQASMTRLNVHYLKQLKGAGSRPLDDGRWLDWLGQGVEPGQVRSVDVMFTRSETPEPEPEPAPPPSDPETEEAPAAEERPAKPATPAANSAQENLVVEVLVIEIPEYRPPPSNESSSK